MGRRRLHGRAQVHLRDARDLLPAVLQHQLNRSFSYEIHANKYIDEANLFHCRVYFNDKKGDMVRAFSSRAPTSRATARDAKFTEPLFVNTELLY